MMGSTDMVFREDIILDKAAFAKAVEEFTALEAQYRKLRTGIEDMINTVKPGFDTPAGRKLVAACEERLFAPLEAQMKVLGRISTTLQESMQAYESVFQAYEELQTMIKQTNT